jgi:hypothetical protein
MWHLPQGIASAAVLGLALLPVRLTAQALGPTADAASAEPPRAHVPRFSTPPAIDGVLDEPVWHSAARLEEFVNSPGDNTAPSHATVVLVGYDARTLYLGIQATDDSALVRATVAARDDILNDDFVGIFLDTFGDRRRARPGSTRPQQMDRGREPVYSVDIVMFSRASGLNGWTVEVAIPLSSLRYSAGPGYRWNARTAAHQDLNNEQDSWMLMAGRRRILTRRQPRWFDALPTRRAVSLIPPSQGAMARACRRATWEACPTPSRTLGAPLPASSKLGLG